MSSNQTFEEFEKLSPKEIIDTIANAEYDVNSWGSCQYTEALKIFVTLLHLSEEFGEKKALELLKLNPTFTGINDWNIIRRQSVLFNLSELNTYVNDEFGVEDNYLDSLDLITDEKKKKKMLVSFDRYIKKLDRTLGEWEELTKNLNDVFEFLKDISQDLWCAAPKVAKWMFRNLNLNEVPKAPGKGPILNVLMQSKNYETGLYCWLIWKEGKKKGWITDEEKHEDLFGGFDT